MATNMQNQGGVLDEKANPHTIENQDHKSDHKDNHDTSKTDAEDRHSQEQHRSAISSVTGHGEDDDTSSIASSQQGDHQQDGEAPVARISTNVSLGPDNPVEHYTSYTEVPDSVYNKFSPSRKLTIVTLLSFCAFLAPISSTTVLSATPEVAAEFRTTGSIVDVTNALYLLFMGISPIVWGPFSEVWGRKVVRRCCPPCGSWLYIKLESSKLFSISFSHCVKKYANHQCDYCRSLVQLHFSFVAAVLAQR